MDKQPDELILQSLRQGSYDAFDALYMRYAPHVEAFAFCMLKNRSEAEDLAHDIFLKIWETRDTRACKPVTNSGSCTSRTF